MTKKEYVFIILDKIKGLWVKEPKIREYLENNEDDEYVEYLFQRFKVVVDKLYSENWQKNMDKFVWMIANIHMKEEMSKKAEEEDLQNLEGLINSL